MERSQMNRRTFLGSALAAAGPWFPGACWAPMKGS